MISYRPIYAHLRVLSKSRDNIKCLSSVSGPTVPKDFDATKYREWIPLENEDHHHDKFSIMSYNLLSRHYMWSKVFGKLDQDYLDWSGYRFPLLNETFQQLRCDIMCFQEMESLMYQNYWERMFSAGGYECKFVRKPAPGYWGDKPIEFMDGVGIFVNTERFEIEESIKIHYGYYITQHKDRFHITEDLRNRVVSRNTVGLLVKLHDKQTGSNVYVVNTHLYWSPKFNDVKVLQTKLLINILQEHIEDIDNDLIVIAGDFNSTPNSCVYELLANGCLNIDDHPEFKDYIYGRGDSLITEDGKILNPFPLSCSYGKLLEVDKLNFTTYNQDFAAVLDHIWTNKRLTPIKVLGEVDKNYLNHGSVNGFPNKQFPSDHIPLVAELGYT